MIKAKFGDRLDGWIQVAFPILFNRRIDPNTLTILGALICFGAAAAFMHGEFRIGALLLMVGGFCDLVDGVVARHRGVESAFGGFLDSTLDRLVDMVVMLGLLLYFAFAGDQTTALVVGLGLISSVMTSYTRARAESLDLPLPGGFVERGERIVLLVAGGLLDLMIPALWVLAVGASATVVQRFEGARRSLVDRKVQRGAAESEGEGQELIHEK